MGIAFALVALLLTVIEMIRTPSNRGNLVVWAVLILSLAIVLGTYGVTSHVG